MIQHNLKRFPPDPDRWSSYYDLSDLDSDVDVLVEAGVDEIWYWYAVGSYEGSGQMILRRRDRFWHHDLGHCSCYGPVDHINLRGEASWPSLEKLEQSMSPDMMVDVGILFEAARKDGYK